VTKPHVIKIGDGYYVSFKSIYLFQPFEITFKTTYKNQIKWKQWEDLKGSKSFDSAWFAE